MASSHTTATSLSTQILSLEPIKPPFGDGIIIVVICALLAVVLAVAFCGTGTAFAEPDTRQRRRQLALTTCSSSFFLAAALVLKAIAAPDASLGYIGWALVGSVSVITLIARHQLAHPQRHTTHQRPPMTEHTKTSTHRPPPAPPKTSPTRLPSASLSYSAQSPCRPRPITYPRPPESCSHS